jgi:hypothetical protein
MHKPIWLLGTLASHARGRVLSEATGAIAVEGLPNNFGMCLAFGSDFQGPATSLQREWVTWTTASGRVLLLVPPFSVTECKVPVSWRAYRPQKPEPNTRDILGKLVASEVRFEIAGALQTAVEVIGEWKGGGVHTAYYRKHPHAGLFAITCLPLWSLTILDHRHTIQEWLGTLGGLAGEPARAIAVEDSSNQFRPNRDHFAMMLHLCERSYGSTDEALDRLADSPVLAIPVDSARVSLVELETAGFVINGGLTELGRSRLLESPYGVYALAMEKNRV